MNTKEIIQKFSDRVLHEIEKNNKTIRSTHIKQVAVKYHGINLGILKAIELFPYEDLEDDCPLNKGYVIVEKEK